MLSCSVLSDFLWPHGLQPTRLLCPWHFPGKNTGVGCQFQYWSGPGIETASPGSPALADGFFTYESLQKHPKYLQRNLFAGQGCRCRWEWTRGHSGSGRKRRARHIGEQDSHTCSTVCKTDRDGKLLYSTGCSAPPSVMTQKSGIRVSGMEVQEGRNICVHRADSRFPAETNTTVWSNYTPIKHQLSSNIK